MLTPQRVGVQISLPAGRAKLPAKKTDQGEFDKSVGRCAFANPGKSDARKRRQRVVVRSESSYLNPSLRAPPRAPANAEVACFWASARPGKSVASGTSSLASIIAHLGTHCESPSPSPVWLLLVGRFIGDFSCNCCPLDFVLLSA
jgi:hypothetical protein